MLSSESCGVLAHLLPTATYKGGPHDHVQFTDGVFKGKRFCDLPSHTTKKWNNWDLNLVFWLHEVKSILLYSKVASKPQKWCFAFFVRERLYSEDSFWAVVAIFYQ